MAEVREIEKNRVEFDIVISPEDFNAELDKVYLKQRGNFRVDGFRRGKAPRHIIERMYGEGVFFDDAIEALLPSEFYKTVIEEKLHPVSDPEYAIKSAGKAEGVACTVTIWVEPTVTLGQYKNIEVQKIHRVATDAMVEAELKKTQNQNARFVDAERPAELGDKTIIDYKGVIDGVQFEGGTAENYTLDLGSGTFIPGFEEQVVGMTVGQTDDIQLKFPEEYHNDEVAGKDVTFTVTVNSIKKKELPAIDDEFASEVSEFDTLEEYKDDIRKNLQKTLDESSENEAVNSLFTKIMEGAEVEIPEIMIREQAEYQIKEMEKNFAAQNIPLDMYLSYMGTNRNEYMEHMLADAKTDIRTQLVLGEIIKAENIDVTKEELDAEILRRAEAAGKTAEEYEKSAGKSELGSIRNKLMNDKLMAVTKGTMVVIDVDEADAAPAEETTDAE